MNELARINNTDQAQLIDYKSIYDLLPSNLDAFYTYSGSLTTPPCYQVVNWIVMAERLNMNAKQIEMFRNLYAPSAHEEGAEDESEPRNPYNLQNRTFQSLTESSRDEVGDHNSNQEQQQQQQRRHGQVEMIMPNVRSLQALNNRTILASFTRYGSRLKAALNHSHSIQRQANAALYYHSLFNVVYLISLLVSSISLASGGGGGGWPDATKATHLRALK